MKRRLLCIAVLGFTALLGAPAERDLGGGLAYVRVHHLPADLPAQPSGSVPPCVVDVRYVDADADAATAFAAWLRFRATPRSPVFVLANADTSAALRAQVAAHPRGAGIVVVGIEHGAFHPESAVKGTAADERRAYDALEKGATLSALVTDHPDKVRNDEASLAKDRLAEAAADAAEDALAGKAPPAPIDVTLQRAVHLHHALVALKKI